MGNSSAKPSTYVSKQWIADRDSSTCHMCCKTFSATRRRHHCRCCGEIFCADCWGTLVELPADYGYHASVPVCIACEALFSGKIRYLRMPRRIVLTRALKSNKSMEKPPLCKEFQESRGFEMFFTKIAHWRPLNDHTHLIFAVTMRTANTNNSSHFNILHVANSPDTRTLLRDESSTPKLSDLDLTRITNKSTALEDLFSDDESASQAAMQRSKQMLGSSPAQPASPPAAKRKHFTGNVQLDVTWILPLDSILSITLDAHPEGDFISIETHQEVYRVQVAEPVGAVTAEQEVQSTPFRAGAKGDSVSGNGRKVVRFDGGGAAPRSPRHSPRQSPRQGSPSRTRAEDTAPVLTNNDDDDDLITSRPRKNARFRVLAEETSKLCEELQNALHLMERRAAYVHSAKA